jgi:phage-related protein
LGLTIVVKYDNMRSMARNTRPISWIKAARKDFEGFPEGARLEILRALTIAAEGGKADIAKPLQGFESGVFEVALPYRRDAYRVIYALRLDTDIWVVHAFQKKSKTGFKTPKVEIDLVRARLKRLKDALS